MIPSPAFHCHAPTLGKLFTQYMSLSESDNKDSIVKAKARTKD